MYRVAVQYFVLQFISYYHTLQCLDQQGCMEASPWYSAINSLRCVASTNYALWGGSCLHDAFMSSLSISNCMRPWALCDFIHVLALYVTIAGCFSSAAGFLAMYIGVWLLSWNALSLQQS